MSRYCSANETDLAGIEKYSLLKEIFLQFVIDGFVIDVLFRRVYRIIMRLF